MSACNSRPAYLKPIYWGQTYAEVIVLSASCKYYSNITSLLAKSIACCSPACMHVCTCVHVCANSINLPSPLQDSCDELTARNAQRLHRRTQTTILCLSSSLQKKSTLLNSSIACRALLSSTVQLVLYRQIYYHTLSANYPRLHF